MSVELGQAAGATDAGRKRRRNEDAYVVQPPLFVVADGMGGARAGEIASQLAAAVFRDFRAGDEPDPEERVAALIQEANRRIYERARSDAEASGMGTTVTAAMLAGDRVAIGHVGDSRAYLLRAGALEQLTDDHSLVADLIRSGRLTPEEAEAHPQRSVITRALGTDPDVDVDTLSIDAEPGDVFLLCSDGLTTMVGEDQIAGAVRESTTLEQAAKALVKAANRHGGEDNITVVLFEVAAREGRGSEQELEDTLSGVEAPTVAAAPKAQTAAEEPVEETGWVTVEEPREKRGRRRARAALLALLALVFVALVLGVAIAGLSRAHFVGAHDDGHVAVYQGVPWELGRGVALYRPRYISRLQTVQLSPAERSELFDHALVSYEEARERVARYELEGVP